MESFRKHLQRRGLSSESVEFTISAVKEFEAYLEKNKTSFESPGLDGLKDYVSLLIKEGKNSVDTLIALARYSSFAKRNDYFIYLASIFGARNVLPDMGERLAVIAGEEARRKVFEGFELPPLGSSPDSYPELTHRIIDRLEAELPSETCRKVLTWNYHKVPAESFRDKKDRFEKAASIDEYLEGEHRRLIKEMEDCMREGRVWYEQEITPDVVEFVKGNQEICTGVRHADRIYVTKIPYAPKHFLREKNPALKRYYACHCPLARTAIRDGKPKISSMFCYCSGGFEKLHFDVIFGEPVEVELLESVLSGDLRCRFANKIPKGKMK